MKMNKSTICSVRGVFAGIYAWGDGWDETTARKWNEFLENYKGIYWSPRKVAGTWYLVGVQGSIFLHPMDFSTILKSCGGCSPRGHNDMLEDCFGGELDELKELCSQLAEHCGGKFVSMVAEAQTIENNNLKQWGKTKE